MFHLLARSLTVFFCATSASTAQEPSVAAGAASGTRPRAMDPYTKGVSEDLERAGYCGTGPFALGGHHGTEDVDALIGGGKVCWLETRHFRLGIDLPPLDLGSADKRTRERIRAELRDLAAVMPAIDPETRTLDPWLRAHLYALRCERAYAGFQQVIGCSDRAFPPKNHTVRFDDEWLGFGPFLGQPAKYVVLVFRESTDLRRYATQYLGADMRWPQRYDLGRGQALMFLTALDFEGNLHDDTALHCHVAFSLVHNFCDGFRGYLFETPVWFKCGYAQAVARRIDPHHPQYDRPPDRRADGRTDWDWTPRVRGLVEHDAARPFAEMATWRDYGPFRFHDYVVAWSRVEFLMTKGDVALARYLHRMKAPLWRGFGTQDWTAVLAQQDRALHEAFGFDDLMALDRAWAAWVGEDGAQRARQTTGKARPPRASPQTRGADR